MFLSRPFKVTMNVEVDKMGLSIPRTLLVSVPGVELVRE